METTDTNVSNLKSEKQLKLSNKCGGVKSEIFPSDVVEWVVVAENSPKLTHLSITAYSIS